MKRTARETVAEKIAKKPVDKLPPAEKKHQQLNKKTEKGFSQFVIHNS
jgi:hypothetical protein